MAFKDLAGVIALIGVVFTSGIIYSKMSDDIGDLKGEIQTLKDNGLGLGEQFSQGNIVLKTQEVECPIGWDELGKTSIIVDPAAKAAFEKYTSTRGTRNGWPAIDFEMCLKE